MKRTLSYVLLAVVFGMASYLLIANVFQFIYLRQYDSFDFNSSQMNRVRSNYELLENNIESITALDTSVFSEEDLMVIQKAMNDNLNTIKKNKLLTYQGVKKIYLKDLLYIDLQNSSGILNTLNILEILEKYDSSMGQVSILFKDEFVSNAYLGEFSIQNALSGYQYHTPSFFENHVLEPSNYKVLSKVYSLNLTISKLNYLSLLIIEVGDQDV